MKRIITKVKVKSGTVPKCPDRYVGGTIIDRTVLVMTKHGEPAEIVLQFCIGCSQYFIEKDVLEVYQVRFGKLDIRVK